MGRCRDVIRLLVAVVMVLVGLKDPLRAMGELEGGPVGRVVEGMVVRHRDFCGVCKCY